MYIYKTTNTLNNKIYIGLSSKLVEESTSYIGSGRLINQAINKYGKEHFTKEIMERDIEDFDLLCEREIYWIKELESKVEHGNYNITDGGEGILGLNHDIETRKKMSEATTELWKDPEHRAKMTKVWKDPEHRAKMGDVVEERWKDPEYKARMSESHKERWKDPEHRAKMSGILWWYNPETCNRRKTKESMPSPWIRGMGKTKH